MGKKIKVTKKQVLLGVGVVVVIGAAILAGAALRWAQGPSQGNQNNTGTPSVQKLPDVVSEVQDLQSQGKTEEAQKKAQEAINNSSTPSEERYMLYIQQGNAKANTGDWQGAIAIYNQAKDIQETFEVYNLLGAAYEQVGDKPKAVEAYKKAITHISPTSPVRDYEKSTLEQKIRDLGGQP